MSLAGLVASIKIPAARIAKAAKDQAAAAGAEVAKPASRYNGELSGVSYIILGVMFGIIVVGLGWCFYRALKANGETAPPQLAEDE